MNILHSSARVIPNWAVLTAFDFRCLWRRWRFGRKMPFRDASGKPTLVIAPHPDDETFGCGALIALKRSAGVPVRVVFLTDGEAVASGVGEKTENVVQARRAQALAACQHLGVDAVDVRWWSLPDGRVPRSKQSNFEESVQRLIAELKMFSAGEIFCPHPQDRHADHIAAAEMARGAVRLGDDRITVVHYPVWMWYHASNGLKSRLDVRTAWRLDGKLAQPKKAAAISAYLDSPVAVSGKPYCGRLPWALLWNFKHASEVFFE